LSTIANSTQASVFKYPGQAHLDQFSGGPMYMFVKTGSTTLTLYYSNNQGSTWSSSTFTFTRTGLQEWSNLITDSLIYLHLAYRVNEGGRDKVCYIRFTKNSDTSYTAGPEVVVSNLADGGTPGSTTGGMSLVVMRFAPHRFKAFIAFGRVSGSLHGVELCSVNIDLGATWTFTATKANFQGSSVWLHTGSGTIRPILELEHIGNGHSSSTWNMWLAWGRTTIRLTKIKYIGRWLLSPSTVTLATGVAAQEAVGGRWAPGVFSVPIPNDTAVTVYERNSANTSTTIRTTPTAHPAGVVKTCAIAFLPKAGGCDFKIFAVGTSNTNIYYIDFTNSGAVWGTWTLAVSTTEDSAGNNWGIRASAHWTAKYDIYSDHASNVQTHTQIAQQVTPGTPFFLTPAEFSTADVGLPLSFTWDFTDLNELETQSAYALSRQIGAGSLSYWRASDSTWQATEQQNSTATQGVTLPAAWGTDGDANHTYKVKIWDSGSLTSGVYSSAAVVVPSVNSTVVMTYPPETYITKALDQFTRSGALNASTPSPTSPGANWVANGWTCDGTKATANPTVIGTPHVADLDINGTGDCRVTLPFELDTTSPSGNDRTVYVAAKYTTTGGGQVIRATIAITPAGVKTMELAKITNGATTVLGTVELVGMPTGTTTAMTMVIALDGHLARVILTQGAMRWELVGVVSDSERTTLAAVDGIRMSLTQPASSTGMKVLELTADAATAAQVHVLSSIEVTWTNTSQSQYRITIIDDSDGLTVYDSQWLVGSADRAYVPGYFLVDNKSYVVQLTTKNSEGLEGAPIRHRISMDYVEPNQPFVTLDPDSENGVITVIIRNPDPQGSTPALHSQDIWRRKVGDTSDGERVVKGLSGA